MTTLAAPSAPSAKRKSPSSQGKLSLKVDRDRDAKAKELQSFGFRDPKEDQQSEGYQETRYATPAQGESVDNISASEEFLEGGDQSEDEDNEASDVEDSDHNECLRKGLEAAYELPLRDTTHIPEFVAQKVGPMCVLLKEAWEAGDTKDLAQQIEITNNELKENQYEAYCIPGVEILAKMSNVRGRVLQFVGAESASTKTNAKIVTVDTLGLLATLTESGIAWKTVAPAKYEPLIRAMGITGKSDQKLIEKVNHSEAAGPLVEFFTHVEDGQTKLANEKMKSLERINKKLKQANNEVGLREGDHELPLGRLQKFLEHKGKRDPNEKENTAWMLHQMGYSGLTDVLCPTLDIENCKLPADAAEDFSRRFTTFKSPLLIGNGEILATSKSTAESESLFVDAQETPNGDTHPTEPGEHQLDGVQHATESTTLSKTNGTPEGKQGDFVGLRKVGVLGPVYKDGITSCGKVVEIQSLNRGSRAIVNVGTEGNPVYRCLPGRTFGRGVLDELAEAFPASHPMRLQDRRAFHVKELLAIVQVESRTDRRYEPITKFLVKWDNGKVCSGERRLRLGHTDANDPCSFPGAREEEWISRSDLIRACGKEWADEQRDTLLAEWRYNCDFLDKMKAEKKHPETGKELDEGLRQTMPWLFPRPVPLQRSTRSTKAQGTNAASANETAQITTNRTKFGADTNVKAQVPT